MDRNAPSRLDVTVRLHLTVLQALPKVLATTAAIAVTAMLLHSGVPGAGAIILGGGMALSSTAVAMQVLQDRAETGTRHGRAAFSVLLFQVPPSPDYRNRTSTASDSDLC